MSYKIYNKNKDILTEVIYKDYHSNKDGFKIISSSHYTSNKDILEEQINENIFNYKAIYNHDYQSYTIYSDIQWNLEYLKEKTILSFNNSKKFEFNNLIKVIHWYPISIFIEEYEKWKIEAFYINMMTWNLLFSDITKLNKTDYTNSLWVLQYKTEKVEYDVSIEYIHNNLKYCSITTNKDRKKDSDTENEIALVFDLEKDELVFNLKDSFAFYNIHTKIHFIHPFNKNYILIDFKFLKWESFSETLLIDLDEKVLIEKSKEWFSINTFFVYDNFILFNYHWDKFYSNIYNIGKEQFILEEWYSCIWKLKNKGILAHRKENKADSPVYIYNLKSKVFLLNDNDIIWIEKTNTNWIYKVYNRKDEINYFDIKTLKYQYEKFMKNF